MGIWKQLFGNFAKYALGSIFGGPIGSALVSYDDNATGRASENDKWFTKLVKGFNNLMNPNHDWFNYDSWNDSYDSLKTKMTGEELTGAEREANEFSADEAQKNRDFQEYMARNKYQMETQSMEQAGINPAMVYGGGNLASSNASGAQASSVTPGSGLNPFDVVFTLARMSRELKLLDAEHANLISSTKKTEAETGKIGAETDFLALQMKYYPNLTEKQIEKFDAEIGVDNARKDELVSEKSLTDAKKVLQEFENKYADEYYDLRNALTDAQGKRELSRKNLNDITTAMYKIEKEYMETYKMKMGSSEAYSVCMAILSAFSLSPDAIATTLKQWWSEAFPPADSSQLKEAWDSLFGKKDNGHHLVKNPTN